MDIDENLDERVDRRLQTRLSRYPDVRVQPVTAGDGVGEFVAGSEQPIQLAVVGGVDAGRDPAARWPGWSLDLRSRRVLGPRRPPVARTVCVPTVKPRQRWLGLAASLHHR